MESQKVTKSDNGPHGKWYGDACGAAFALELIGERWSLLIMRELMLGPRRFSDIRADLPGISAKVLSERLAGLEAYGVLVRRTVPEPTPARLYELTKWGYAAEPILLELGRWAAASPLHDPRLPLSPVSFMLSLRTMLDRAAARDLSAVVVFAIGTVRFTACLKDGEIAIERGETVPADLRFTAPSGPVMAAVFYGRAAPSDVGVVIEGDPALARRVIAFFDLPRIFEMEPRPARAAHGPTRSDDADVSR
ncbi:helix-turn-helix transcriptional regulator [Jiella sp. MQZ9-1]|uniref:Helix-turn-helix transcriptional regulator n=2 Tax=Jiella flava TaxID=2816857 RepID=A0A939G302_9HYPH|nr:helix-turn-helix domain-containing protein [Jiella flava]MBO0664292.1 helix-turn-helix transcriptional regulator [Jiella flava]MCD2472785.1 helix-turn-helix transcriptional regulator [Jiella flava]